MEVHLLDIVLSLVDEQQLRREGLQLLAGRLSCGILASRVLVGLHGQIPHRHLVVRAGERYHGLIMRSPTTGASEIG